MTTIETQAIVAVFKDHSAAEAAVKELHAAGVPLQHISIIGKDWQAREDIQGYYQPADAVKDSLKEGAWFGGLFGLLLGLGLFIVPVAGTLVVLGPLSGLIAGAVGGAGVGALVGALTSLGIPKDQALKYQTNLEAGEFLVIAHGPADEVEKAKETLHSTTPSDLQIHSTAA